MLSQCLSRLLLILIYKGVMGDPSLSRDRPVLHRPRPLSGFPNMGGSSHLAMPPPAISPTTARYTQSSRYADSEGLYLCLFVVILVCISDHFPQSGTRTSTVNLEQRDDTASNLKCRISTSCQLFKSYNLQLISHFT